MERFKPCVNMDVSIENLKILFELMKTSEITLPVFDIVGLVFFLTVCILARSPRAGLIVAFIFSCKFAWPFIEQFGAAWSVAYVAFALTAAIFSILESFMGNK
jgi:hypothetical protein